MSYPTVLTRQPSFFWVHLESVESWASSHKEQVSLLIANTFLLRLLILNLLHCLCNLLLKEVLFIIYCHTELIVKQFGKHYWYIRTFSHYVDSRDFPWCPQTGFVSRHHPQ